MPVTEPNRMDFVILSLTDAVQCYHNHFLRAQMFYFILLRVRKRENESECYYTQASTKTTANNKYNHDALDRKIEKTIEKRVKEKKKKINMQQQCERNSFEYMLLFVILERSQMNAVYVCFEINTISLERFQPENYSQLKDENIINTKY